MRLPGQLCEKTGPTVPFSAIVSPLRQKCLGMRLLGRHRGHQLGEPDDIEDPPEIVGERSQAELGADLLQATHQKRTLVHPLFNRAERMFDRLASAVEDIRAFRQSGLHPVQYRFVLETRYRAKLAPVHRARIAQSSHASLLT